ncbi:MAG: hypothetical protein GXX01_01650 [Clostridiales bacterium]|nr:hypothetical protein [Clostridiales bacterium]
MKNKTLLLARTLIKNGEGLNLKGSSTFTKIAILIVFAILIPSFMFGIAFVVTGLLTVLKSMGQEGVILSWGIAINSTIVFVFGIFYVISTFYFSSDVEMLLPMPLKPRQIVAAKFLVVTIYEYFTTAIFFLPIWITYGVYMKCSPMFYLYGLIVFLLLPVTPLSIASVIIMIIMRFTNLSRYKDTVRMLGGMIGIFLGLGLNIVMQNVLGRMSPEEIMELVQKGENSLVVLTSGIFPTARWGAEAMIYHNQLSGFMSLLIYAGFSILIFMILLWLAQLIYLKGAAGLSETGSKRNKQGRKQLAEEAVRGSVIGTYTRTELKLLFRTPIYFINCVMINFLWPIFILLPLIFQPEEINVIRELSQVMNRPGIEGMILAGAFIAALFFSASNGITSTSISREGQELFIKKYLPVSYRQQLTAKILSGFLLGLVSVLSMIIFGILVLKISIWLSLLILAVVWLPVLYTSLTGLLIDLYNPKLDWDSEQKAVKQNINVLYNMLAAFVPAIGSAAVFIFSLSLPAALIILALEYVLLCLLLGKLLFTKGVERFIQLEV